MKKVLSLLVISLILVLAISFILFIFLVILGGDGDKGFIDIIG